MQETVSNNIMVTYNIHHQDLVHSGVNTHAQIDAHIDSITNPHGITWTQDMLVVNTVNLATPGTVGGVTINGGSLTNVTFPNVKLGAIDNTPITYFSEATTTMTSTSSPGANQQLNFFFVRINNVCKVNAPCYIIGNVSPSPNTNNFIWPSVIPANMRPASDIHRAHPMITNSSRVIGMLTLGSSGDITISPQWPSTGGTWTFNYTLQSINEIWTV